MGDGRLLGRSNPPPHSEEKRKVSGPLASLKRSFTLPLIGTSPFQFCLFSALEADYLFVFLLMNSMRPMKSFYLWFPSIHRRNLQKLEN